MYIGSDGFHPSFLIVSYVCLLACIGRPKHSAWLTAKQRTFFNEKKIEVEAARRLLPAATQEVVVEAQKYNAKEARFDVEGNLVKYMYGNEEKVADSEEARVDISNEMEEEMDRNKEKAANYEEARVDVQNEVEEKMDGNKEKAVNPDESRVDVPNEVNERVDGEEREFNAEEAKLDAQNETMDDDVSRKDSFYDTKADDGTASVQLLLFIGVIFGLAVTWYLSKLQRKQQSGLHKKLDVAAVYRPACIDLSYC